MPIVSGFVVGFVNRQSRGVLKVQRELRENENGEAVYDFGYQTAVLVCEKKSPRGERLKEEAIKNGWLKENAQKPSEMTEKDVMDNQKPSNVMENESKTVTETEKPSFPNLMVQNVYQAIKMNRKALDMKIEIYSDSESPVPTPMIMFTHGDRFEELYDKLFNKGAI